MLFVDQRQQHSCILDSTHDHRLVASADCDFLLRQGVGINSRGGANFIRDDGLACQALGHVLQPGRNIDGIAECGEHHVIAVADVADDHFAAIDADAEAKRLAQIMLEKPVQFVDIGGDQRRRLQGLTARLLPAGR